MKSYRVTSLKDTNQEAIDSLLYDAMAIISNGRASDDVQQPLWDGATQKWLTRYQSYLHEKYKDGFDVA